MHESWDIQNKLILQDDKLFHVFKKFVFHIFNLQSSGRGEKSLHLRSVITESLKLCGELMSLSGIIHTSLFRNRTISLSGGLFSEVCPSYVFSIFIVLYVIFRFQGRKRILINKITCEFYLFIKKGHRKMQCEMERQENTC